MVHWNLQSYDKLREHWASPVVGCSALAPQQGSIMYVVKGGRCKEGGQPPQIFQNFKNASLIMYVYILYIAPKKILKSPLFFKLRAFFTYHPPKEIFLGPPQ